MTLCLNKCNVYELQTSKFLACMLAKMNSNFILAWWRGEKSIYHGQIQPAPTYKASPIICGASQWSAVGWEPSNSGNALQQKRLNNFRNSSGICLLSVYETCPTCWALSWKMIHQVTLFKDPEMPWSKIMCDLPQSCPAYAKSGW